MAGLEQVTDGDGTPTGRSAGDPLVETLDWFSRKLVADLPEVEVADSVELEWGVDAGSSPPSYWHWLHVRELDRLEHPSDYPTPTPPPDGPLLSVVVPVYRPSLWFFRQCVQSVLAQTYPRWELCLCDDGSNDPDLTAALAEFAAGDPRIHVLGSDENGGISRATNRALEAATGEFAVLLDHDDVLVDDALAGIAVAIAATPDTDVIYSDEDKFDELDRPFMPHFKPDWDPDLLLAYPYLGHVTVIRRQLLDRIGGFRPEFDGGQDYDVMLRATERARSIVHIPKVLYHCRVVEGSGGGDSDVEPSAHPASRRAVEDAVARRGLGATVESGPFPGAHHVRLPIRDSPTVSVIIPFRDQAALTMACLDSFEIDPGYQIDEIVLVDNGSTEPETKALRMRLEQRPNVRILDYPGAFNWAAINNFAAATCTSDMLLLLNNDVEVTTEGWLHALVELGQREDVGAVGARLIFPDGRLQHAGMVLGLCGIASHIFLGLPKGVRGYFSWDAVVREYSAVSAACMLVRKGVFDELGGFDEKFAVGFNDVDFCIRLGQAGYRVLFTPHAELTHHESISRGLSGFRQDYEEFLRRWIPLLKREDPYYNRNLSRIKPWCPLRFPGEDEEWLRLVGGLVSPPGSTARESDEALDPLTDESSAAALLADDGAHPVTAE